MNLGVAFFSLPLLSVWVQADTLPGTLHLVQITAVSNGVTGTVSELIPDSGGSDPQFWSLSSPSPWTIMDSSGSVELGTIDSMSITLFADPEVDLTFSLRNGDRVNPTAFSIQTTTIQFAPIFQPEALAAASISITDGLGSPAGVAVTGGFPDGKLYQARYSTDELINTGTAFANLVSSLSVPFGQTLSEDKPGGGLYSSISGPVYMMEAEYRFTLSAGDQASGTSAFIIVPEPCTLLLGVAGAGIAMLRRRRPATIAD